ncbi:MAG: alkaline phosphatase family protein [Planctomycetota bacterium]
MGIEKVAVFGLDCAEPSLVFDRWLHELPNLRRLMQSGTYGELTSCMPPITVPAWSCMASSKDPGTLGIYGFRNRADHSYDKLSIATSLAVKEPRIWDILTTQGRSSIIVGIPGTYPISKPINGQLITSFLTPDTNDPKIQWTHPPELRKEVNDLVGEYLVDVKGFRTDDKQWLLDQIYLMTEKRFKVVRHLLTTRPWDLFWMVEMGVDRIHHGFWSCMDPSHHAHVPNNPFLNSIRDYYKYVDGEIGKTLALFDLAKTAIWVVSDHGAKTMVGGCCFNQWLINEGYLHFKSPPTPKQKFDVKDVDWTKTKAWGDGGYYGRLFLNIAGREPNGIVPKDEIESLRSELAVKIEAIRDHKGQLMGNKCYRPEKIYARVNGVAPDLIVIFGDLRWRSVGFVGSDTLYTFENDTGPDDANHAQQGMYIVNHPTISPKGRVDGPTLYDVTPTILKQLSIPVPSDMRGHALT